ncbi:MAG: M1 family metallopeptidase [Balneolales bacterium]|nr:M1 family metallopeptidase [Balneolales bacterium]
MIKIYPALLMLTALLVAWACSSSEKTTKEQRTQNLMLLHDTRPIPYPIDIPGEYLAAIEAGTRTETGAPGEHFWQQYASYDIEATLNPVTKKLEGQMRATYFNQSPDELGRLHMELALNVHRKGVVRARTQDITGGKQIQAVTVNGRRLTEGQNRFPAYVVQGTQLIIYLAEGLPSGGEVEVEIEWTAEIPRRGASGRNGWADDLFFLGYWYPQFSVYDDVYGWFTEPFRGNAEFYHGFADYRLAITMPDDWVVMATGDFLNPDETLAPHVLERYLAAKESDEVIHVITAEDFGRNATAESENGMLTWHFESERVRDVAFSATRKSFWDARRTPVGDLTGDGQTNYSLMNAFYRELAPLWTEMAEYNAHAISFLSEMTGFPYPWPHMTSVEGSTIIGGGMEYPMMTLMGDYNQRGAMALYSVTAHELAHMWFPMIVSTNERIYTWIDEGNTVFATDEARHSRFPEVDKHAGTQQSYISFARNNREGELMRWSDFHYSQQAYGIASYPKPASVLVALRGVIGEDAFWEAYRTIVQEWAFKQMYPWDMFRTFERVSGMDLGWFWRSWYYETWTLNQGIAGLHIEDGESVIRIRDYGNVPMPVLLRITRANGEVNDARISHEHWLTGTRNAEYRAPYTDILRVEIDPDRHFPDIDRNNMVYDIR